MAQQAWQNQGRVSTLEILAALAEFRCRADGTQRTKLLHILDSQVVYQVVAKGSASSKRLNRLARLVMAVLLSGQLQHLVLWTISAWNYADAASWRFASHHGPKFHLSF